MVNKILIDTNVLLDYLLTRESFYEDAKDAISVCLLIPFRICFSY